MRVSRWLAPVVSVVLLFGGVGLAQLNGWWITSGRQALVPGVAMTVDDLRGWMTLQQAATGLGLRVPEIIAEIDPPDGVVLSAATAVKDIEAIVPGFELADLRERLRERLSGPATADPATPAATPPAVGTPTHEPTAGGSGSTVTGQHSLRQVADGAGVDLAPLIAEAGLPPGTDPDVPLRVLRDTVPGFEIQQVRDALERLG